MRSNILDERERQLLGRIEHIALNATQVLLSVLIVIQLLIGADFRQIAGECIVMVIVGIGMIAGYVYYGIWDTDAAPSRNGNIRYAGISGVCLGLLVAGITRHVLRALLAAVLMFLLTFGLLNILMKSVEKRQTQQAEAYERDE